LASVKFALAGSIESLLQILESPPRRRIDSGVVGQHEVTKQRIAGDSQMPQTLRGIRQAPERLGING
jgi:hypothetical protein